MNTIYDGTYVIGQTSATNFVAGPGIKIDEPSAGTVRIGNDETVLFSGTGVANATLSESMLNFERLKIKLGNTGGTDGTQYFEFPAQPSAFKNLSYQAGGGANFYFVGLYCSATDTSITITKEAAVIKPFGNTTVNGQDTNAGYSAAIHEVIGINRKEV